MLNAFLTMPSHLAPSQAESDTIIAPATPAGEGGISVVRISGPDASSVLRKCFRPARRQCRWSSHRMYFGELWDARTQTSIDQGLAVLMRAPRSYTGEDVAELHLHGSPEVVRQVLELARQDGVRLAQPGEFTLRAVLNGRMDLAQAESVLETITAKSERALRQAAEGLSGSFSRSVERIRQALVQSQAFIEASIDFSEDEIPTEDVLGPLERALDALDALEQRARHGLLYRSGARVTLTGRPNVGKSSLLNALLRSNRAIVTAVPGTTRDTLEETAVIHGIPMVLVDTAGIRATQDEVERIGVDRARAAVDQSALVVLVLDQSQPLSEDDRSAIANVDATGIIVVLNKADLPTAVRADELRQLMPGAAPVEISALTGQGLNELENRLAETLAPGTDGAGGDEIVLAIPRHLESLERATTALQHALDALRQEQPLDLVAGEVSLAARALGEITGVNATEDLFDTIFSRFCLGK